MSMSVSEHAAWRNGSELLPLVRNWWMVAARGALAVLFGAAILFWSAPIFTVVAGAFGAYAIADGLLAIASAVRSHSVRTAGWSIVLEGIVSVALGALALNGPLLPERVIGTLIVWGLGTGIMEIVAAVVLPRGMAAHWLFATAGASSIFLALVVLVMPHAASDRMATALGIYAIVFGVAVLLAALRFRLAARRAA